MGFLNKVIEKKAELESSDSTINSSLNFFDFAKKYNLNCCCCFSKKENYYYISNSVGYDGESILKSYSTDDFWNGSLLEENKVFTFLNSDDSLNTYKQFFSENLLITLEKLSIIKNSKTILFIINSSIESLSEQIIKDFNAVSESISAKFNAVETYDNFLINFDEALDSYIYTKGNQNQVIEVFKESLFNEICNSLRIFFSAEAVKKNDNPFEITINIPADFSIKEELLFRHLVLNLTYILEDSAPLISIYKN